MKRAAEEAQESANRNAIKAAKKAIQSLLTSETCKSDCPAMVLIQTKEPKAEKSKEPQKKGGAMEAYAKATWEAALLCIPRSTLEKMIDKVGDGGGNCKVFNKSQDIEKKGKGTDPGAAQEAARKSAADAVSLIKQLMDKEIKNCSTECPIVVSIWNDGTGAPSPATKESEHKYWSTVSGRVTAIYGCLPAKALPKVGDFMKTSEHIGESERQKWFVPSTELGTTGR